MTVQAYWDLLLDTIFPAQPRFTEPELRAAMAIAAHYDLDPVLKEIYVARYQNRLLTMVGIGGWVRAALRTGELGGIGPEEYSYTEDGFLESCVCPVWRKGCEHPFAFRVRFAEWMMPSSPTWKTHPEHMLRMKSMKLGLRFGFGLSGLDMEEPGEIINGADTGLTPGAAPSVGGPPVPPPTQEGA